MSTGLTGAGPNYSFHIWESRSDSYSLPRLPEIGQERGRRRYAHGTLSSILLRPKIRRHQDENFIIHHPSAHATDDS